MFCDRRTVNVEVELVNGISVLKAVAPPDSCVLFTIKQVVIDCFVSIQPSVGEL